MFFGRDKRFGVLLMFRASSLCFVSLNIYDMYCKKSVNDIIIWLIDFACCDWSIPGP